MKRDEQYSLLRGRMAAEDQSRIIEETHQFMLNLSQVPEIRLNTLPECNDLLINFLIRYEDEYSNIQIVSPEGETLCSGQNNEYGSLAEDVLFKKTLDTLLFSVGDYTSSSLNQKPVIQVGLPILDDYSQVQSILIVSINTEYINRILDRIELPRGASASLVDRNGTIIARTPEPDGWIGKGYPYFGELLAGLNGMTEHFFELREDGGVLWDYVVTRVRGLGDFYLIIRHAKTPFSDETNTLLFYNGTIVLVSLVLMVITSQILSRIFIVKPLDETIRVADDLSKGIYHTHNGWERETGLFRKLRQSINHVSDSYRRQTSEQKEMERLLRQEENRFQAIADFSNNWECWINPDGTYGYNSPACEMITGYKPDELVRDSDIMQAITYPLDRDRMMEHLRIVHANMRSEPSSIEFRIITKGGKIRWLSHTCRPIFGAENEYIGRRVTHQDITPRKQTEESLRSTAQRFLSIVENQGEGIAIFDAEQHFTFSNPAADLIFGLNPGELIGRNLKEFVIPDHLADLNSLIDTIQKGEKTTGELSFLRKDGKKRIILIDASPQYSKDGRFAGAFGVFRDITEQKQREDRLLYTSTHDTLTGLYNRAFFEEEIEKTQNSNNWPVSIIVIDVDDLKIVNDRMGHTAGDELLRRTAKILRTALRPWDIVARFGGDEFVILLPNIGYEGGQEILDRIRGVFEQHNSTTSEPPLNISLGLATGETNTVLIDVFNRADAQMYRDKKAKADNHHL